MTVGKMAKAEHYRDKKLLEGIRYCLDFLQVNLLPLPHPMPKSNLSLTREIETLQEISSVEQGVRQADLFSVF